MKPRPGVPVALWTLLLAAVLGLASTPVLADGRAPQDVGPSPPEYGAPADGFGLSSPFWKRADVVDVPILMYHHVRVLSPQASRLWLRLTVDPTAFEAQMAYLAGHGYHTITFSDLAACFDRGKPLPDNPVILTFDDGWAEQYTTVFPILRRYGLIATFFPPTNWINGSGLTLNWAQVEEMSQAGMEFGSHTLNHHILSDQTPDEVRRQLVQSKAILEQHIHRPVVALAYPTGAWSSAVAALVPRAGYRVAVGTLPGVDQRAADRFALHRVSVGYGVPLRTFITRLGPAAMSKTRAQGFGEGRLPMPPL
jgi:peptidoglycan/xylan/chitin deacetylase (PgdA/CDA1 family)